MTTDIPQVVEAQPATTAPESIKNAAKQAERVAASADQNMSEEQTVEEVAEKEPTEEELKALSGLQDLKDQGTRAFAVKNYAEAVEKFCTATELLSAAYGPLSPKCADMLFLYGNALYQLAVSQSSILGDKVSSEATDKTETNAADNAETVAAAAEEKTKAGTFAFNDEAAPATSASTSEESAEKTEVEEVGADEAEEEEEEEEEEDKDDFETAWEALDMARVIYSKMDGAESSRPLADTLMLLGEVSLESENFVDAVKDFGRGLELLEKICTPTDRVLAHSHFQLSLALEYTCETDKAIEHVQKSIDVLNKRIAEINADETLKAAKAEEIKEMEQLTTELNRRLEDLKTTPAKVESESSAGFKETSVASASTVNDLSALVKSKKIDPFKFVEEANAAHGVKRKAEETSASEDSKKIKEAAN